MDISVQYTNARINRMSRRRQKIAMMKRRTTVFKNAWPKSVGVDPGTDVSKMSVVVMSVSFNPK